MDVLQKNWGTKLHRILQDPQKIWHLQVYNLQALRERKRQHETRREHEGHTEDEIMTLTKKKKNKGSREDKYDSNVINGHQQRKWHVKEMEKSWRRQKKVRLCHFVIVRKCQRLTVACEWHSPLQTLTTTDEKRPAKRRKRSQTQREEEHRLTLNSKLS